MARPQPTRQSRGREGTDEVLFLEVDDGVHGLWLRIVASEGPVRREASIWAVHFGPEGVEGGHQVFDLATLDSMSFEGPLGGLRDGRFRGEVGGLKFDLLLDGESGPEDLVPPWLRNLGVGRRYFTEEESVVATGWFERGGQRIALAGARGVLGHIWGGRNRLQSWTWAHASAFEGREDVVFQGLSARLKVGVPLPPLTTATLKIGQRKWRFDGARSLMGRSRFGAGLTFRGQPHQWDFVLQDGDARLKGQVRLDPRSAAVVRYTGPHGDVHRCTNHKFGHLELHLTDDGVDERLVSERCAFEWADRREPRSPLVRG